MKNSQVVTLINNELDKLKATDNIDKQFNESSLLIFNLLYENKLHNIDDIVFIFFRGELVKVGQEKGLKTDKINKILDDTYEIVIILYE